MMSEEKAEKFLSELPSYKAAVESLRPIRRLMLLCSVVSLVYIHSDLQLQVDTISLWGVQITVGITEEWLPIFLFLATFYCVLRWFWLNFLKFRMYWREGFISELLKHLMSPKRAVETESYLAFVEGFNEVAIKKGIPINETIAIITNDRDLSGAVRDLARFNVVPRMELFIVPHVFPFAVSVWALVALLYRLL